MDVRAFNPVDVKLLEVQPEQSLSMLWMDDRQAEHLAGMRSYTGWVGGKPVICGGLAELWKGRAVAWTWIAWWAGPHFPAIHKAAKRVLYSSGYRRIEAAVACDFPQAHRWVRMLGFELEAERMRGYAPSGQDHALYALVR